MITHGPTRWMLNRAYLLLGSRGASLFYTRTAKIFRDVDASDVRGGWTARVAGMLVRLPLRGDRMWLDWDQAVSIAGHEPAVKQAYAQFLNGALRPDLFVDVGANYGTHSLLFLSAGVRTLSFEPNDACHPYFAEACAENGFCADVQPVALGDTPGEITLSFPAGQTWLGSIDADVVARLGSAGALETRHVQVRRLDEYADAFIGKRVLLKIDAEGHELAVLRGAQRVLREHRPHVLFESLPESDRGALFDLFARAGYNLAPLTNDEGPASLSRGEFVRAPVSDFLATPTRPTQPQSVTGDPADAPRASPLR